MINTHTDDRFILHTIHSNGMNTKQNVYVLVEKYSGKLVGVYKTQEQAVIASRAEGFIPHKKSHIIYEEEVGTEGIAKIRKQYGDKA